ncbi:HAMP domain-containing histidine kinase [Solirubrobacter sp. CPCC 204708]|uniref:histidine kinase n=1 Tax=Solirubrobacter deserti TaxID=2282478 RepID=A0ABT4RF24_9ACTN|nr:HAMP domain-containing sensor histidine kinase [Solirubrobacter deserti]MBE2319578.1 HAMP domain-containing histidine kinase [Solirubrobacter deserti]MDA0137135.1 HAMP domain-containing histidine kinase [Solirubrobacter deserti]
MPRRAGLSARLKLTLSYAGVIVVSGTLLLAVVWVFLLRYVPETAPISGGDGFRAPRWFTPSRSDLQEAFAPKAALALGFLLVLGLAGGWLLAGRMLAPLTRIGDAARLAARGSLSHRVRLEGPKDEFRELADVFDTMLEQLESHVDEQRRFAANASHELRTPLAISQTLLDVARSDPTRDQRELIERLHTVNTRAIEVTEALLLLSRGNGRNFTREAVDLSLLAEEAAETLLALAEARAITLEVTGEKAQTVGSTALLARMVTNLVQNAIVHNLASRGTVTVHTEARADASVLRVENTGHPLPPGLVATLTEPFQRGTERIRTDEHAGVGLGLAIVQSIVRAHDGALELAPRSGGGLVVSVSLPRGGHAASWKSEERGSSGSSPEAQ